MSNLSQYIHTWKLLHRHPWVHTFAFIDFWCFQNAKIHSNNQLTRSLRVSQQCIENDFPHQTCLFPFCLPCVRHRRFCSKKHTRAAGFEVAAEDALQPRSQQFINNNLCLPTRLLLLPETSYSTESKFSRS